MKGFNNMYVILNTEYFAYKESGTYFIILT